MNMMNWWRWNHEIRRWQTDDNFTNSDPRDFKYIRLDKLGSRLVQRTCSRCSATQVERVFWLVNGFPTDSAAYSTIELFDCVIYKLIDTATWRWYCSVIGLFYFVVSHNTQTYFRLQGQFTGGLSFLIGRFPLCLLVLFILRKIQPDFGRYQSERAQIRKVNGACFTANAISLLELSWDRNLVNKPVVTRRYRQFPTQWAFAGFSQLFESKF